MPHPHKHTRTSARSLREPAAQPRTAAGAWSEALAASPRQQRQAAQLRRLFGDTPRAPGTGVVQGMFLDPDGNEIDNEEDALDLARRFIGKKKVSRDQREAFEQALVELATDGDDHRQLSRSDLSDLLQRGPVRESFGMKQQGRRLHTFLEDEPNFPPERSETFKLLEEKKNAPSKKRKRAKLDSDSDSENDSGQETQEESQGDFTYRDLRAILERAGIDRVAPAVLEKATRQAVQDFEEKALSFSEEHSVDVQLVVQHILQYHRFNSPLLKGRQRTSKRPETKKQRESRLEREEENEQRQHEFEKSGRLLKIDAPNRFLLTMPPDPKGPRDSSFAFSALQDVNRPLPNSTLEGATYKAVYLCVKKVLGESWRIARRKRPKARNLDLDKQQRQHFNRVLLDLLPKLDRSVVEDKKEGLDYIQNTLGFSRFTGEDGYSDEDSSSSEDEQESKGKSTPKKKKKPKKDPFPKEMERSILDVREDIETNEPKIKTWTATVGTFSKLALQKQLIDRGTLSGEELEKAEKKHARRRGKIDRHVNRVSVKLLRHFRVTNSELNYLRNKREMLEARIEEFDDELAKKHNEATTRRLKRQRAKLVKLLKELNGFYESTPVSELTELARSRSWKRSRPEFKFLGPKTLESYLQDSDDEKEKKTGNTKGRGRGRGGSGSK